MRLADRTMQLTKEATDQAGVTPDRLRLRRVSQRGTLCLPQRAPLASGPIGKAPDSGSGDWRFESSLASHLLPRPLRPDYFTLKLSHFVVAAPCVAALAIVTCKR